jgi:Spy/CpxP family protein refolding chaperone
MKTKVLMLAVLMSMSVVLVAQPVDKGSRMHFGSQQREMRVHNDQRGSENGLNLTDAQKEAFKLSLLAMQKQIQPLRNVLVEAKAHQKSLMNAEKPDLATISKNLEIIEGLRVEMEKIQAKTRLDLRAQLNDEQRLKFDNFKGRMMQERGLRGMRFEMGMHNGHSLN